MLLCSSHDKRWHGGLEEDFIHCFYMGMLIRNDTNVVKPSCLTTLLELRAAPIVESYHPCITIVKSRPLPRSLHHKPPTECFLLLCPSPVARDVSSWLAGV